MNNPKYEIYYDGRCYICSWDVNWLKNKDPEAKLFKLIDFNNPDSQLPLDQISRKDFDSELHLRILESGEWFRGVGAVILILDEFPAYRWMSKFYRFPIIYPIAKLVYYLFARGRRWLPKRRVDLK